MPEDQTQTHVQEQEQAQAPSQAQAHAPKRAQGAQAQPPGVRARIEAKFPRGLVIRLFAYLFAGHLFAFFLYLLFALGGEGR